MKIIVLGGDGFCGWPTSLKLAKDGHEVRILDNLIRRQIDEELESNSLTDIASIQKRIEVASKKIGRISFKKIDVRNYEALYNEVMDFTPDAIIHFAEQRAAPYSMISSKHRNYTVNNNISATANVLNVIVDVNPTIHLVHLGTMGVYGYSKDFGSIPEGYLDITVNETEKKVNILYPTNPGSIYHMTKSMDQIMFQFYHKNWGLKITDLHQGIVWGIQTKETQIDPALINRFDYDGMYGTVLNRFISQAAIGNDITVYGTGGQKRAFIHIQDTVKCVQLACENPPTVKDTRVRIFNQISEVRSVKELAEYCAIAYNANISYVDNPRKELAENDLEVHNEGLISLGFEPITLQKNLADEVEQLAKACADGLNVERILSSPEW